MSAGQELARALRAAYWAMHRRTNALLAAQCHRQMLSGVRYGSARNLSKNLRQIAQILEAYSKRDL